MKIRTRWLRAAVLLLVASATLVVSVPKRSHAQAEPPQEQTQLELRLRVADLEARFKQLEALQRAIEGRLHNIEAAVSARSEPATPRLPAEPISIENMPFLGDKDATVVVVEFGDFQCPYCRRYARETFPTIHAEFVATGRVRYVFQHLPLSNVHPAAVRAAEAAECAFRLGRFWQMHDALLASAAFDDVSLMTMARESGLGEVPFTGCLQGQALPEVQAQASRARQWGLSATPSFFVGRLLADGRVRVDKVIRGAQPTDVFRRELTSALSVSPAR